MSSRATPYFHNRIAVVFDFDLTLGEGSVDVLLKRLGQDPERFRAEDVEPLNQAGWDSSLGRFKALIDLSERLGGAITQEVLEEVGCSTPLYPGVGQLFDRLRDTARAIVEDVAVEFYVLTAGFAEVPGATPIAHGQPPGRTPTGLAPPLAWSFPSGPGGGPASHSLDPRGLPSRWYLGCRAGWTRRKEARRCRRWMRCAAWAC